MRAAVYIGDEAHAAAWRLIGIESRIASTETDIARVLEDVRGNARLLMLSPECAAQLPAALLARAQRAPSPLLLVLPGAAAPAAGSELAQRVRRQLGMES